MDGHIPVFFERDPMQITEDFLEMLDFFTFLLYTFYTEIAV